MTFLYETEIPDWVEFVAQDKSGEWHGYQYEPLPCRDDWMPSLGIGRIVQIGRGEPNPKWKDTLSRLVEC